MAKILQKEKEKNAEKTLIRISGMTMIGYRPPLPANT
jgi:hypothetical protein